MSFKPIRAKLSVSRKEYITPHYLRVYLTGDDITKIANTTVGINNKIVIPPVGIQEIHFPEMDMETRKWKPIPEAVRPSIRTYTHRGIRLEKNEIWIDFVVHGKEGPASAWAIEAQVGDPLGVMMKDGKRELYPPAENYFLVGDATALPVISAILEDLPTSATGTCLLEVYDKTEELPLTTRADIQLIWLHNSDPKKGSNLAKVAQMQSLPESHRFAYIAAEFSTVKQLRTYLRKEQNWQREELYAYSYWKAGEAEDRSEKNRRQELATDQ